MIAVCSMHSVVTASFCKICFRLSADGVMITASLALRKDSAGLTTK